MAKIEIEFGANFEKYWKSFAENQSKTISGIESIKSTFQTIAGASIMGYGIKQLFDFGLQSVKSAAQLDVLRSSFRGTAEDLELFRKATAQTVTEADLLKLSNQASDLGISLSDQAILFSLAEDRADSYGGSVQENFAALIAVSEGAEKGLKKIGVEKAKYDEIVMRYVKGTGAEQLSQLDAETQKWIHVKAIIEATGLTLEDVNNKLQDNADKIESVGVKWEETKTRIGEFLNPLLKGILDFFLWIDEAAINAGNSIDRALGTKIFGWDNSKPPDRTKEKTDLDQALGNRTYVKNGKVVSEAIMPDAKITPKATKDAELIQTDAILKKELARVDAALKANAQGREKNELLKKQAELEDKLYGYDRAMNMTDAAKKANLGVRGIDNIPIDKNSFNDKFFTSKNQSASMPNVPDGLMEIDDTWKQIGESAADATNMMSNGLARAITKGENLGETLKNVGSSFLESGLAMLFSIGMKAGLTSMGVPAYLFANGGVIAEPVIGMGLNSKQSYLFGEAGNEIVIPASRYQSGGGAPAQNINIQVGGTLTANGTELHAVLKRIDKLEKRYK